MLDTQIIAANIQRLNVKSVGWSGCVRMIFPFWFKCSRSTKRVQSGHTKRFATIPNINKKNSNYLGNIPELWNGSKISLLAT